MMNDPVLMMLQDFWDGASIDELVERYGVDRELVEGIIRLSISTKLRRRSEPNMLKQRSASRV